MNKYYIHKIYSEEYDKIKYLINLEKNGFIIQSNYKISRASQYIENNLNYVYNLLSKTLNDNFTYFREQIYKNILNEDYTPKNKTFLYQKYPQIYKYVDYVEMKINEFIDEVNSLYGGNYKYIYEDPILTPFFYAYGKIDYGKITEICPKYKINIFTLEELIYYYYTLYKELCLVNINTLNNYNYNLEIFTIFNEIEKIKYIAKKFILILLDQHTYEKINHTLNKFTQDLLFVQNEISRIYENVDKGIYNFKTEVDEILINVLDTQFLFPKLMHLLNESYKKLDTIEEQRKGYLQEIYNYKIQIDNLCDKWATIVKKFPDEYNSLKYMI